MFPGVSASLDQKDVIILKQIDISNTTVQDLEKVEESENIQSTINDNAIHLNPYYDALQLSLPRFNARDFFNFANIGKNTSFKESVLKMGTLELHKDVVRVLFKTMPKSTILNFFLVGDYAEVIQYAETIYVGEDAPERISLDFLGFCRDPYTKQEMSDIYRNYDSFQTFNSGKWIVGPSDDGVLSWSNLNWFLEETLRNLDQDPPMQSPTSRLDHLSIYCGSEFMEPDYSIERFEQDYLGILTTTIKTMVGGNSAFSLLWPVNGTSSALHGLLSYLYESFSITKRLDKSPIDPNIIIFAGNRKDIPLDILKHLCRQDKFMKNLSFFERVTDGAFSSYFKKKRPRYEKHFEEITRQWEF